MAAILNGATVNSKTLLRALRRAGRGLGYLIFSALLLLATQVVSSTLPEVLRSKTSSRGTSFTDRQGVALGEQRGEAYLRSLPVAGLAIPRHLERALIAAEDSRFYWHPGVDPVATMRAIAKFVLRGRIVSGGSTLTQQLARSVVPRPRSLLGKWQEWVLALRIESSLTKPEILRAYFDHVAFGPNSRGVRLAAQDYFGKNLSELSVAECATLAALPRGPSSYHPRKAVARLLARRNWVLSRLVDTGDLALDEARRARVTPLLVRDAVEHAEPRHLLRALVSGRLQEPTLSVARASVVRTTLDEQLQAALTAVVAQSKPHLQAVGASAASLVVVDNASLAVLAYVGSPAFFDEEAQGQNDGCLSLRQPGSTLKPFLYALGMDQFKLSATTLLADVQTEFTTERGLFAPRNYDGRFHGPVLLREALASSLNVPAVALTERVGVARFLTVLQKSGLRSLTEPPAYYGLALALGDGEVRLTELVEAFATLANRGLHRRLRVISEVETGDGRRQLPREQPVERVFSEDASVLVTQILSDDSARIGSFGRHRELELPFAVAVKTGTSQNHRDNWTVGYSREVTVGVWVGNFDGRPLLLGTTGVVGAAPIFVAAMKRAMRERTPAPLVPEGYLHTETVCALSGKRPTAHCPSTIEVPDRRDVTPRATCDIHQRVEVDPLNGMPAGSGCPGALARVVERYPEYLQAWAKEASRPSLSGDCSPRCPCPRAAAAGGGLQLKSPAPLGVYRWDPQLQAAQQGIITEVSVDRQVAWVEYRIDEAQSGHLIAPYRWRWPLRRGLHTVTVMASTGAEVRSSFRVD